MTLNIRGRGGMKPYAGLDVSLEETSVCILDETGKTFWMRPARSAVRSRSPAIQRIFCAFTVAERVAQVPGDRLDDQRRLEVPTLEVGLRPALQLGRDGAQDHGWPPGSEAQTRPVCLTSREPHKLCDRPITRAHYANCAASRACKNTSLPLKRMM